MSKRGKIVSKRQSAHGKRQYQNIKSWTDAVMKARSSLSVKGFVAINGHTLVGKALFVKAKALRGAASTTETSA